MKSYKVEVEEITTYVFDIQAENEEEAREKCATQWEEVASAGTHHYYETGDTRTSIESVFDVTGTDDDNFINNN